MIKILIITTLLVALSQISFSQVRLPKIFGDHMVFQQNQPFKVWGWANPGEKLIITFNNLKSWSNNPSDANLYNKKGLPAESFRTDTWEVSTQNQKYQKWIK